MKIFSQPVVPISPVIRFACASLAFLMWGTSLIMLWAMAREFSTLTFEFELWLFGIAFFLATLPGALMFTAAAMNRFNGGHLSRRAFNWRIERLKRFLRLTPV